MKWIPKLFDSKKLICRGKYRIIANIQTVIYKQWRLIRIRSFWLTFTVHTPRFPVTTVFVHRVLLSHPLYSLHRENPLPSCIRKLRVPVLPCTADSYSYIVRFWGILPSQRRFISDSHSYVEGSWSIQLVPLRITTDSHSYIVRSWGIQLVQKNTATDSPLYTACAQ